jgi:hypothetical protein
LLAGLLPKSSSTGIQSGHDVLNVWGSDETLKRLLRSNGALGQDIQGDVTEEEEAAKKVLMAVRLNLRLYCDI